MADEWWIFITDGFGIYGTVECTRPPNPLAVKPSMLIDVSVDAKTKISMCNEMCPFSVNETTENRAD